MEAPRGYISTLTFPIPDDVDVEVSVEKEGTAITPWTVTPEVDAKTVDISLPYSATHEEDVINVSITFEIDSIEYTKSVQLELFTPYLELHEIKDILPSTATDEECWTVEQGVRGVIDSYTGQNFGVKEDTVVVTGYHEKSLRSPAPILRLDKVVEGETTVYDVSVSVGDGFLGKGEYETRGDGWFLNRDSWTTDSYRNSVEYYSSDPIVAPSFRDNKFKSKYKYQITGRFGYESIPDGVREATKLLVNDYACADALYRDRYLQSIRAADWRIQFAPGAYNHTGNARADLLLNPYVVNRMQVI